MAFIHKIIKGGSDFFKSIKSDNKKQLTELEKLEKEITQFKAEEKKQWYQPILTNRTFLKFWIIGMIVIFLAYITFQSLNIIYLIFTAYIISLALEAIIDFFQRKLSHRGIAIVIAYFLLIILLLWWFVFIIPFVFDQIAKIMDILVANISHIQELLKTQSLTDIITNANWIPWAIKKAFLQSVSDPTIVSGIQSKLQQNITQLIDLGKTYARDIGNIAIGFVGNFFSFIAQSSIVLTLAILFSIQKDSVMKFISGLWGEKQYKFIYMKLERIYKKLWIWLKSQLFLCLFIGGMMYLWLWILSWFGVDVPQKWALAIIAGLTELIPYIGPFIGWFVAALVACINVGVYAALLVIGITIFIQWFENNVLIPVLMHKTLGVNPVLIFISMIIWGIIMGVVGVLLAVPIAVIITLILEKTLEE